MTNEERQRAKIEADPDFHLYEGECIIYDRKTKFLSKETDLCLSCGQEEAEFGDQKNVSLFDPNDKETEFRHEKSIKGWSNDMTEEIWNMHFRYK